MYSFFDNTREGESRRGHHELTPEGVAASGATVRGGGLRGLHGRDAEASRGRPDLRVRIPVRGSVVEGELRCRAPLKGRRGVRGRKSED